MPRRLSTYLKETYGEKIYRLSLSSGCTCPNRDGSIVTPDGKKLTKGCTFCSEQGSGEFAAKIAPIDVQIEDAKAKVKETVNDAKDAIKEKVNPSTEDFDDFDKPASNPEPATTEDVDIPKVKKDEGIDFMEDELSDL